MASDRLGAPPETFWVFLEINDPGKLDPADALLDSRLSGIDQPSRLRAWERVGARIIDLDYIQPALSDDGQAPEAGLLLALIPPAPASSLPAPRLRAHLERFFGISVLKGRPLPEVALIQIQACRNRQDYILRLPTERVSATIRSSAP